jgi:TP901 family phage tail tape measure protein
MNVLRASVESAKAGMTSTAVAADALTTVLNAYGLSGEKSTDVSDLLFQVVKRGKLNFEELAGSIGRVVPIAASSGVTLEEVGAILATTTRAGLDAAEATTSFRGILTSLLTPTKEASGALQELGFSTDVPIFKQKSLTDVMNILISSTDQQKLAIFGNVRALTGFSSVVQQNTEYQKDLEIMTKRSGSTAVAYGQATNTAAFGVAKMREALSQVSIIMGEKLFPVIQTVSKSVSGFADLLKSLPAGIITFGVTLAAMSGILTSVGGGILVVWGNILKMVSAMATLNTTTKMLTLTTAGYLGIISLTVAAAVTLSEALEKLKTAADANNAEIDKGNQAILSNQQIMERAANANRAYAAATTKAEKDKILAQTSAAEISKGLLMMAEVQERAGHSEKAARWKEEATAYSQLAKTKTATDKEKAASTSQTNALITEDERKKNDLMFELGKIDSDSRTAFLKKAVDQTKEGTVQRYEAEKSLVQFKFETAKTAYENDVNLGNMTVEQKIARLEELKNIAQGWAEYDGTISKNLTEMKKGLIDEEYQAEYKKRDAVLQMESDLSNDLASLGMVTADMRIADIDREARRRITQAANAKMTDIELAEYSIKVNAVAAEKKIKITNEEAKIKRDKAIETAEQGVKLLGYLLGSETEGFETRKEQAIFMLNVEKALAIAKLYTQSIAMGGPLGLLTAAAGTLQIISEYNAQIGAINQASSKMNEGKLDFETNLTDLEKMRLDTSAANIDKQLDATSKLTDLEKERTAAAQEGTASRVAGMKGEEYKQENNYNIEVGGVVVNVDLGAITVASDEQFESLLTRIGDACAQSVYPAVLMALKIFKTAQNRIAEAT